MHHRNSVSGFMNSGYEFKIMHSGVKHRANKSARQETRRWISSDPLDRILLTQ